MPRPESSAHRPPRLVLYVDDSAFWHAAARLVGEYARARGAHVTVTSALLLPGKRQRALDDAAKLLRLPDTHVKLVGRPGIIEYTLPDVAREEKADIVVVGRLGSADRLTSGLIAHLVAKRTPANVLIARAKVAKIERVLVCTEGSEHGEVNFRRACDIASVFGARVDVLHVVSQMGLTDTGTAELEEDLRDFVASDAPEAEHLRRLRDEMTARHVEGRVLVRRGLVVEEVLDALHEGGHDLLVIGAHDPHGRGHLYEDIGSLILRSSPVSTLMVRDRTQSPESVSTTKSGR